MNALLPATLPERELYSSKLVDSTWPPNGDQLMSDSPAKYGSVREWIEARRKEKQPAPGNSVTVSPTRGVSVNATLREAGSTADLCLTTTGARTSGGVTVVQGRFDVGMPLGKYVLTDQIGKGGTALVFRAVHRALKKPVAIKLINLSSGDPTVRPGQVEQLRREAELLAQLNHPNVVRVLDFDELDGIPYLVLEFVDGMALNELISYCGRLRPDKAARVIGLVAEGLSAAQSLGIVHRDVKPGNILLARDGGVKLADLGLALVIHDTVLDGMDVEASLPPMLAGTVAYVSPEQANAAGAVDHRADIYSLGATFYHAITGEMPFKGRSRMEILYKQAKESPTPPQDLVPGLDPAIAEIIAKMMAKDPAERYQTYEDLFAALKPFRT